MPRKKRDPLPPGAAVQSDNPAPIRPQITQMSGYKDIDEVIAEAPESTQEETPAVGPNGRRLKKDGTERAAKRRRSVTVDETDPMSDPRYRQAVAGMNFYGAPRVIKRGFSTVAALTHDDSLDLNDQENQAIDDYFYAVSKHMTFDPMSTIIGRVLLLILLIGEIIGTRVLMRSKFGTQLKELIIGESETTTLQDNSSVRPGSVGEDFPSSPLD